MQTLTHKCGNDIRKKKKLLLSNCDFAQLSCYSKCYKNCHLLKISYQMPFQDPTLNDISIVPHSKIFMTTMLVILRVGN
jgi:hypothetical protein